MLLTLIAMAAALLVYYAELRLGWNPGAWALPQSALIGYLTAAPRRGSRNPAGITGGVLKEDEWQRQVIDTAHIFGWRCAHFRSVFDGKAKRWRTPVQADGAGFPDLILCRDAIIAVELKTDDPRSDLSPEQRLWLLAFEAAGVENHVWRPRDAEAVMQRLARRRSSR